MKISARNILKCKVESLTPGAVNEEVVLKLSNGAKITSIITKNSVSNLNLKLAMKFLPLLNQAR